MQDEQFSTVKDKEGNEYETDKWIEVGEGEETEKVMFLKSQPVSFCKVHKFNKEHECTKCPFIFRGFKAHLHIQKDDGIYDRESGKKIV